VTTLSVDQARARLTVVGSVTIEYGDLRLEAERDQFEQVRRHVADLPAEERRRMLPSVDRALRKFAKRVKAGKPMSRRQCDNFHADLLLWKREILH
jgi:hypothetical protein